MENLVFGIITILICLAGYIEAFRRFRQHRVMLALILLMLCGFLLRLYTATDFFLHEWDERYHALVAKNLMGHPLKPTLYDTPLLPYDYRNWTSNHIWLHKQPLPLWSIAGSMSLFGVNEIALRLPSILLTTAGIWITFSIGCYLFNKRVAFIASFLYSIHGLIIEMTAGRVATDHIDIFFLFFIQLSVWLAILFVRKKKILYNLFCGVSIGFAILSKWLPALIVLPIWILLLLDSKKFSWREILINFALLCIMIFAVVLPWQLHIHRAFPLETGWESSMRLKHLTEVLDQQGGPFYYHFDRLRIIFGELIYIPLLWFIWYTLKKPGHYRRWLLLIWFMVPFIFFSLAKTKMQGYTLFTAPAIFIITGLFWQYLYQYRQRFRIKWPIYALLVLLLALPVRYSLERMKPFTQRDRNPEWTRVLRGMGKTIDDKGNVVIFNVERPVETMFYMNCTAYPGIPDSATIREIIATGHRVIINEAREIPSGIMKINGLEIVNLKEPIQ